MNKIFYRGFEIEENNGYYSVVFYGEETILDSLEEAKKEIDDFIKYEIEDDDE